MTVKLYESGDEGRKKGKKQKKDINRVDFFYEMSLHSQKMIVQTMGLEISVLRVLGGWIYVTETTRSVSTDFVSEKEMDEKLKIEEG